MEDNEGIEVCTTECSCNLTLPLRKTFSGSRRLFVTGKGDWGRITGKLTGERSEDKAELCETRTQGLHTPIGIEDLISPQHV